MKQQLPDQRLQRLREGFDLTIARLYAEKARQGYPVVVAAADGTPIHLPPEEALARIKKPKAF